jgi:hypothetical protein
MLELSMAQMLLVCAGCAFNSLMIGASIVVAHAGSRTAIGGAVRDVRP